MTTLLTTTRTAIAHYPGGAVTKYQQQAVSDATKRAYANDFCHFTAWCEDQSATSLPAAPPVVAAYLEHLADNGYKTSTISRRMSAISVVHQAAGEESPTRDTRVRASMQGIRRVLGSAVEQKTPLLSEDLRAAFGSMGDTLRDDRDRALLAVGFAGGFRRSELVALEVADLEEVPEGYRVTVRRSKTDQDGAGMTKALVYGQHDQTCPVRLLRGYMQRGGITEGPIFRPTRGGEWNRALTDRTVANIVKRAAALVGKAPGAFSGHSLRRGFVTEAARNGASERAIAKQTGHHSIVVLRGYIEDATVFEDNAVASLGL